MTGLTWAEGTLLDPVWVAAAVGAGLGAFGAILLRPGSSPGGATDLDSPPPA